MKATIGSRFFSVVKKKRRIPLAGRPQTLSERAKLYDKLGTNAFTNKPVLRAAVDAALNRPNRGDGEALFIGLKTAVKGARARQKRARTLIDSRANKKGK